MLNKFDLGKNIQIYNLNIWKKIDWLQHIFIFNLKDENLDSINLINKYI